jgi:hypothetical protein
MPRDGSLTPADLVGKLEWLYVHCDKCVYNVARLVEQLGADAKLTDWLAGITPDARSAAASTCRISVVRAARTCPAGAVSLVLAMRPGA